MGQGPCLGALPGAEPFGGRTPGQCVLSRGHAGHSQLPGDRPRGESLSLGLRYRFPPSLLGLRGPPVQRVANWLPLSAAALDDSAFDLGLFLIGRFQGSQELALGLVEVPVGGTAGDLLQFRTGGTGPGCCPERRRGLRCFLKIDGLPAAAATRRRRDGCDGRIRRGWYRRCGWVAVLGAYGRVRGYRSGRSGLLGTQSLRGGLALSGV